MLISFFRSSQSCTSPPLTPKSQRRTTQKTASQSVVSDVDDFSSYATIPCNCSCDVSTSATTTSTSNGQNKNAYFNYVIPRTLYKQVRINIIPKPENTHSHYKGKYCCMAAWLTSCLTGLDIAALLTFNQQQIYLIGQIQTSRIGGHLYSDTSPFKFSDCSLPKPWRSFVEGNEQLNWPNTSTLCAA